MGVLLAGLACGGDPAQPDGPTPAQARWIVRELDTPAGRGSTAGALNEAGQVAGRYSTYADYGGCLVPFLWQRGKLTRLREDECQSDMCVSNYALALTPEGRVLGRSHRICWTGGYVSFWLAPPAPALERVFGDSYPELPAPAAGQPSRTCSLAADGSTACRRYRPVYGPDLEEWCSDQLNSWALALNDRGDLVAYLDQCEDPDTGEQLGPRSYILAGADGWLTFGPRGQAALNALNSKGWVVGAIPVPAGGRHAFRRPASACPRRGRTGGRQRRRRARAALGAGRAGAAARASGREA